MSDWHLNLFGFKAWSAKLKQLLKKADAAVKASNDPKNKKRQAVSAELVTFQQFCPDFYKLDSIADKALIALIKSAISKSQEILKEAAEELGEHSKAVKGIAKETSTKAGWLSLKTPKAVVGKLNDTIKAFTALYDTTKNYKNVKDVKAKVDSVVSAIKDLKKEVESAGGG